jgi:transcriptional regulator with XRE-family HTH domain
MAKPEVKHKIIPLLEKNGDGMTQNKIAEALNVSRPTIKKYLEDLQRENRVLLKQIGVHKVWTVNDLIITPPNKVLQFVMDLLLRFIVSTERLTKENIDWKEVGKDIGNALNFSDIILTSKLLKSFSINQFFDKSFFGLVSIFEEIMKLFTNLLGEGRLNTPPTIFENEKFFIYRISDVNYVDFPLFFPIFSGILEIQIKQYHGASIGVNCEINQTEKLVDIKVQVLT